MTDLVVGDGAEAVPGATVLVHYVGVDFETGEQFDASWDRGEPIRFPLRGLIQGWQDGIPGMRVGGRRQLVIPPALAYGESGGHRLAGTHAGLRHRPARRGLTRPLPGMTAHRTERLLNLLLCLMSTGAAGVRGRSCVEVVPGYAASPSDERLRADVRAGQGGAAGHGRARGDGAHVADDGEVQGYRIRRGTTPCRS